MKTTYKIFDSSVSNQSQIDHNYARYIETADDIFGLFIRSCISNRFNKPIVFLIVDKSQKQIDFFKDLLAWDGELDSLLPALYAATKRLEIDIESIDTITSRIGQEVGNNFDHLKKSWQIFKNSEFKFVNLDVVEDNKQFLKVLHSLLDLPEANQLLRLNFSHNNSTEYTEAINNVLHFLFVKSIRNYQSVVALANAENNTIVNFAGELYAQFNPTFCILPWMHVQYKPGGQSKLCCRYDTSKDSTESANERVKLTIQQTSIEDSFYSNYWDSARNLTLSNQPIPGCYKCYEEEKSSKPGTIVSSSMRLGSSVLYNHGYLHKKRPEYQDPKIEFLEIGFGNYCNLACLSCNSTLSTNWHDDEILLNKSVDKKLQRVVFPKLDNLKFEPNEHTLKTLKLIKFTGGEPMINPEFAKFIELICSKGYPENISLEIYTNCSYIPSAKLLANLEKFKNVQLNLSVDAHGHTNDYIRYGSVWQGDQIHTVSGAIDYWLSASKKYKNIHISMATTLSILNILEMPSLIEWWVEKFINDGNVDKLGCRTDSNYYIFFKIQPMYDPNYLNVNSLPKESYQDVLDWIQTYKDSFLKKYPVLPIKSAASIVFNLDRLKNLVNSAKGNADQADGCIKYLKAMDSIRKNSCQESISEIVTRVNKYLESQAQA